MKNIVYLSIVLLSFSLSANEKPKVSVEQLQRFALEKQMPSTVGYDIRARKIVVAPGATIAKHGHKTRAGIVYVESGEIVEYRGKVSRTLVAGDSLVEDFSTEHSYINSSKQNCVLLAFDIPKSEVKK